MSIINQFQLKCKLIIKVRCKSCSAMSTLPRGVKVKVSVRNRNQLPLLHRRDQIFENVTTQWRFASECGSLRVVDDILSLSAWLAVVKGSKKSAGIRSKFACMKGIGDHVPENARLTENREEPRNPKVAIRKMTVFRYSRC